MTARLRVPLFAGAAVCLGLASAAAILEMALRVFQLAPAAGVTSVTESEYSAVPGLFSPGQRLIDRRIPALPFSVAINDLGYRGAAPTPTRVPNELRVLAVGDSFTFGDFVDDHETLPAQLEKLLSKLCNRPVTVVNAGVGGTTIVTHLQMVRRAWVLSPDIVLLTFSENDVTDLRSPMWDALAANRRAKSRFPLSVAYPILRRLALWHFALDTRAQLQARRAGSAVAAGESGSEQELREEYERLLQELLGEVQAEGRPLFLAMFPSHLTLSGIRSHEQLHWLQAVARGLDIPTVDLSVALQSSGEDMEALYLLPHDGHASPAGNAVAASALAEVLSEVTACAEK